MCWTIDPHVVMTPTGILVFNKFNPAEILEMFIPFSEGQGPAPKMTGWWYTYPNDGKMMGQWLVAGWPTPLKNMSSSVGMMIYSHIYIYVYIYIYGPMKFMFQTTNQMRSTIFQWFGKSSTVSWHHHTPALGQSRVSGISPFAKTDRLPIHITWRNLDPSTNLSLFWWVFPLTAGPTIWTAADRPVQHWRFAHHLHSPWASPSVLPHLSPWSTDDHGAKHGQGTSQTWLINVDECWWRLMKVDESWWRLFNVDKCWWRLMKVDEGCLRLMNVDEGWWRLMNVDKCWWRLMKVV